MPSSYFYSLTLVACLGLHPLSVCCDRFEIGFRLPSSGLQAEGRDFVRSGNFNAHLCFVPVTCNFTLHANVRSKSIISVPAHFVLLPASQILNRNSCKEYGQGLISCHMKNYGLAQAASFFQSESECCSCVV